MQEQLSLPGNIWKNLNLAWAGLFVVLGFANLAAMQYFSCNGWVNFKLYGTTSIIFGFSVLQALVLSKHLSEESH
jgi:intracellular septation protein